MEISDMPPKQHALLRNVPHPFAWTIIVLLFAVALYSGLQLMNVNFSQTQAETLRRATKEPEPVRDVSVFNDGVGVRTPSKAVTFPFTEGEDILPN